MSDVVLTSSITKDRYTDVAFNAFDLPVKESNEVVIKNNIVLPDVWNIGLICGPSGAGKSTLLKTFGELESHVWSNDISLISNFTMVEPDQAAEILSAVGLSTIPAWIRPYNVLSTGEKFRADLAMTIAKNETGLILIDEFTSVVDRNVAKAASYALQKYARRNNLKIILASCHLDIVEWLSPDWLYNPLEEETKYPRGSLQRPKINIQIFRSKYEAWNLFKQHHYLSQDLPKTAKCFTFYWNEVPVAFVAVLHFPHPRVTKAYRASRTVVLPDYQGLGIGVRISDYMGSLVKEKEGHYYSRTAHPAMIKYRLNHPELWRVTSKGILKGYGKSSTIRKNYAFLDEKSRYSFEYIGPPSSEEEAKIFWEPLAIQERKGI